MTSPKKRGRARRRVERTMEEAFEALERGERALADKLSRRAAEEGHVNPRIWHDRARVASTLGDEESAELALRQAIAIAPGYSEAHADLGRMLSRRGRIQPARRALARALQSCGRDPRIREAIEAELATLPAEAAEVEAEDPCAHEVDDAGPVPLGPRAARVDWDLVEARLHARGAVRVGRYFAADRLGSLVPARRDRVGGARDAQDAMATPGDDEQRAQVHYPPKPLPPELEVLRAELFESLLGIARRFEERFDRRPEFPGTWAAMAAADPGPRVDVGFAWLHADRRLGPLRVERTRPDFPFRVIAALEVPPEAVVRHELIDLRPGRKRHGVAVDLRAGDLAITCARRRIVSVGGIAGLQDVAHCTSVVGGDEATVLFLSFGGLG